MKLKEIIKNITVSYKYCYKCRQKRLFWLKSQKPYVVKITKGTSYQCLKCNL